jgi:hypothetical protein
VFRRPFAAAALLAVLAPPALAQRAGFWGGISLGPGVRSSRCDSCGKQGPAIAPAMIGRLGYTLSPRVLIGVEVDVWTQQKTDIAGGATTLGLTWYPAPRRGFFLKGGIGSSWFRRQTGSDDDNRPIYATGSGPGFMVGAGWDARATPTVSFTPSLTVWGGAPGDVRDRFSMETPFGTFGQPDRGLAQVAVQVGIGMTFH